MANTAKPLYRGVASTTLSTVLYTAPASTTAVVTSIVIANTAGAPATYTLTLNNIVMSPNIVIAGNSMAVLDVKQVIDSGQTIKGGASSVAVNFHISGMEIA